MKLPVLIPANNEADYIGMALASMDSNSDPIVLANGCTDATAEIARNAGATVVELEEPSKMRAIQHGLRMITDRATEGWVIMDADVTILSRKYSSTVQERLARTAAKNVLMVAPLLYRNEQHSLVNGWSVLAGLRKSAMLLAKPEGRVPIHGPNMMMQTSKDAIEELLSLPDYWPGEDRAIRDVLIKHHDAEAVLTVHPSLVVATSTRGRGSLIDRMMMTGEAHTEQRSEWWSLRSGAEEKIAYTSSAQLNALQGDQLDNLDDQQAQIAA